MGTFRYNSADQITTARKWWEVLTWSLTWWIPSIFLRWSGMRSPTVQMAWREKVAICIVVFLACAATLFVIIGVPMLLCPRENVLSLGELGNYNTTKKYVGAYGRYYDFGPLMEKHVQFAEDVEMQYVLGKDVSDMFFPADDWKRACPSDDIPDPGPMWDNLSHERKPRWFWPHRAQNPDTGEYKNFMGILNDKKKKYLVGDIVWELDEVKRQGGNNLKFVVIYDKVYDVSSYVTSPTAFFDPLVSEMFDKYAGTDATPYMSALMKTNPRYYASVVKCMNSIFYVGRVDHRKDVKCYVSNAILMSLSVIMAGIVYIKFVIALFGLFNSAASPTRKDNPVLVQVTCYSEGNDELEATFTSVANSRYGERDRVMVVVCDGMVRGTGGDQTTPDIVLSILYGDNVPRRPKPYAYEAIGEGKKGINRAMIYAGTWQDSSMEIYKPLPFIVIVKCGNEGEMEKPGNRGKRDSQVMMMRFLNRVYGGDKAVLSPFELRLWDRMEHVTKRSPKDFEFFCMIDADTVIDPDAINHLVSTMCNQADVVGVCGLTEISNPMESWVTCIQVFEYYIQHFLGKNFESQIGSVTCLPGCFSMYRIRSSDVRKPKLFLASSQVLDDYAVTKVNTLHMKNLFTLGEDRYLTTLFLKHFPDFKTKFNHNAICLTKVPSRIGVFFSQRRRWSNSTFANLWVLMGMSDLRGCLCFSIRFIVLVEFISAMIAPAAVLYLYYLAVMVYLDLTTIPVISGALMASIYILQVFIAFFRLKWEHLGWMIIYLVCSVFPPILTLFLPLYSFWNYDTISWGITRQVIGDNGATIEIGDADDAFFKIEDHIKMDTYVSYSSKKEKRRGKGGSQDGVGSEVSTVAPSQFTPYYQQPYNVQVPYNMPMYAPSNIVGNYAVPQGVAHSVVGIPPAHVAHVPNYASSYVSYNRAWYGAGQDGFDVNPNDAVDGTIDDIDVQSSVSNVEHRRKSKKKSRKQG